MIDLENATTLANRFLPPNNYEQARALLRTILPLLQESGVLVVRKRGTFSLERYFTENRGVRITFYREEMICCTAHGGSTQWYQNDFIIDPLPLICLVEVLTGVCNFLKLPELQLIDT